jgi:hypothetical protein
MRITLKQNQIEALIEHLTAILPFRRELESWDQEELALLEVLKKIDK